MAFTAADVMKRASTILQDDGAVRWTAPELREYLNDGLTELVALKPNARTKTVTLAMVEGPKQELAPEYTMLSRVICNRITGNARAIRALSKREIMDSQIPGWQEHAVLPYSAAVTHVIHDLSDPRTFYVVPGNNGTGQIEAVVGAIPDPVPAPASNTMDIDAYVAEVDVPAIYQNALVDYVLFRAFSKDAGVAGAGQRAVAHFELFKAGVTGFGAAEAAMSVAAYASRPPQG
jgi:hypothetical protein